MHLIPVCRLSAERVREELFNGGFRPMKKEDFYTYADAEEGSLIANISVGRFTFDMIFSPSVGSVQIFDYSDKEEAHVWDMDLTDGSLIEL